MSVHSKQSERSSEGLGPALAFCPYMPPLLEELDAFYAQHRSTPLFWSQELKCWIVTSYEGVTTIARNDDGAFSSREALFPVTPLSPSAISVLYQQGFGFRQTVLTADGDEHAQLRGMLLKAFRPQRMLHMKREIRQIANDLADTFHAEEVVDVIERFATPFPLRVIFRLFAIPEHDQEECWRWSQQAHAIGGPYLTEPEQIVCMDGFASLQHYFADLLAVRSRQPGEDIVSQFATSLPDDGWDEAVKNMSNMLLGVLIAGYEPVTHVLGNALALLLQRSDLWHSLHLHPERCASLVEEVLRFDSPVQGFYRTAVRDVVLHAVQIKAGDRVFLAYGSANRDPLRFDKAEQFLPDRRLTASDHLAFGAGPHYCIGASLARMQLRVALDVLSSRFPTLSLMDSPTEHIPSLNFRGWKHLFVRPDGAGGEKKE